MNGKRSRIFSISHTAAVWGAVADPTVDVQSVSRCRRTSVPMKCGFCVQIYTCDRSTDSKTSDVTEMCVVSDVHHNILGERSWSRIASSHLIPLHPTLSHLIPLQCALQRQRSSCRRSADRLRVHSFRSQENGVQRGGGKGSGEACRAAGRSYFKYCRLHRVELVRS